MMRSNGFRVAGLAVGLAFLVACSALKGGYTLPDLHPEEIPRATNPVCGECHDDDDTLRYTDFDHGPTWYDRHRFNTYQNEKVCSMCHADRFCGECHAGRVELKPSTFRQADTYRKMPHRGDYLSRHRIDARIDPSSCFRCHGNPATSKSCAPCHG
jgi:hypothetical protein